MADSQNPKSPNYTPGVGRLVTDRFDFQKHINGTDFRHNATQVDLSPVLTLNSQTYNTVQEALAALVAQGTLTVPDATTTTKGIIQLGGDLAGTGTSATTPKVSGLLGYPIQNVVPTTNYALVWNGSAWSPSLISNIINSQISASAAISGTKINPDFGSQTVQTTGLVKATDFASQSTNVASSGTLRDGNNTTIIAARNATNTGDLSVLKTAGDNSITLGSTTDSNLNIDAKTAGILNVGTFQVANFGTTFGPLLFSFLAGITFNVNPISLSDSPYTMDSSGYPETLLFVDCSAGAVLINAPNPSNAGRFIIVLDYTGSSATHTIQVNGYSGGTISGSTSKQIVTNYGMMLLISDGTNWQSAKLTPP